MKSTVKFRVKKLADGNGSYYLDWFQNRKPRKPEIGATNPHQRENQLIERQADKMKVFDVPLQQTCDKALQIAQQTLKHK